MKLARVYPIVDSAAWVKRLAPLGVRLVQLRIKEQPQERVRGEIREARACCAAAAMQLIVNDHWQLALEAGRDFVHPGQGGLDGAGGNALRPGRLRPGVLTAHQGQVS